jgi:curved DNA-binding protein CbpA
MTASPEPKPQPDPADPVRLLREAVDGARSGSLEWPSLAEAGPIVLRQGKLLLRKESALGLRGQPAPQPAPGSDTLATVENPAEAHLLRILAGRIARPRGPASFREGDTAAGERLVGPLHARPLLMEGAVSGHSDAELVTALGGEGACLQALRESPATQALASYPEPLRRLVSRLADPTRLGDLLRLSSSSRAATLADLGRLRAAGLVDVVEVVPPRESAGSGDASWVEPAVLSRFRDRIARSLAERPLSLEVEDHRARIGERLRDGGGDTHYALLGLSETAGPEDVAAAYEELARVVHPSHGATLGLPGGAEVLDALFERLTHAYRTLSDPDRRRAYDLDTGAGASPLRDLSEEEMEGVRKRMAASGYRRALEHLEEEDFHYAVELMRDAVRWDPRPEYWSLLGQAQSHNPKWTDHALESFREAIRLDPKELKYRLQLAAALEEIGRGEQALEQYRELLEGSPDLAAAREGVERLEARQRVENPTMRDRLRGWLGLSD